MVQQNASEYINTKNFIYRNPYNTFEHNQYIHGNTQSMVEYIMQHDIVYTGTEFHFQCVYLWECLCRLAVNVSPGTQTIHLRRNCFFVDGIHSAK